MKAIRSALAQPSPNPRASLSRLAKVIWGLAAGMLALCAISTAASGVDLAHILAGNIEAVRAGASLPFGLDAAPSASADSASQIQIAAGVAEGMVSGLAWIAILVATIRAFRHIERGESPFSRFVTKRLELIGVLLVFDSLLPGLLGAAFALMLGEMGIIKTGTPWEATMSFAGLGAGLIFFAVAAAFEYGAQIQRDVDGLV